MAVLVVLQSVGCGRSEQDGAPTQRTASSTVSPATADDPLQGEWHVTKAIINGETFPQNGEEDIHVGGIYEFQSGTLTKRPNPSFARFEVVPATRHTYTLNTEANPPQIDVEEPDKDAAAWPTENLIYKLQGDQLTLCWSIDMESPRPTDFETQEGDNKGLYVLERASQ